MQPKKVTLTVAQGRLPEHEYVFEEPHRCIIGRAPDCDIWVPMNYEYGDVSRHHCQLDIDPPRIRVRDLGSRNGTFINGDNIGQRAQYVPPEEADLEWCAPQELKDGDEIRVGGVIFQVGVPARA